MAGDEAQLPALRGGGGSCADSVERDLGAEGGFGGGFGGGGTIFLRVRPAR